MPLPGVGATGFEPATSAKARGRNGGRPGKQNEKAEMVMALYDSGMNMKPNNTRVSMVLTSFLYVMKNIVVGCQKMCYNPKRAIVLQGALTSF